ncbi:MAG: hypothetical protein V1758_05480 [Pseudomonadota bacterium]
MANALGNDLPNVTENLITCKVLERIIVGLEIVYIDKEMRESGPLPLALTTSSWRRLKECP